VLGLESEHCLPETELKLDERRRVERLVERWVGELVVSMVGKKGELSVVWTVD
jgi:hypothetical protein